MYEHLLSRAPPFLEVIRAGSFRAAASTLRLGVSTTSESIRSLEEEFGVLLLTRTTRTVKPIEDVHRLAGSVERALAEWAEGILAMCASANEPTGRLRVAAPGYIGNRVVASLAAEFMRRFPRVEFELPAEDRVAELIAKRFDFAIRIGTTSDSGLIARRIAYDEEIVVAAPLFAAAVDAADVPGIEQLPWCGHEGLSNSRREIVAQGGQTTVLVRYRCMSSPSKGLLVFVELGLGVADDATDSTRTT